mmetsp:Transcript_74721/g.161586  ORF Transcript_74721/g.161586 Transcript_74721/m.161586 type:complete len:301 (-) Transcript_74721:893-1795(-)
MFPEDLARLELGFFQRDIMFFVTNGILGCIFGFRRIIFMFDFIVNKFLGEFVAAAEQVVFDLVAGLGFPLLVDYFVFQLDGLECGQAEHDLGLLEVDLVEARVGDGGELEVVAVIKLLQQGVAPFPGSAAGCLVILLYALAVELVALVELRAALPDLVDHFCQLEKFQYTVVEFAEVESQLQAFVFGVGEKLLFLFLNAVVLVQGSELFLVGRVVVVVAEHVVFRGEHSPLAVVDEVVGEHEELAVAHFLGQAVDLQTEMFGRQVFLGVHPCRSVHLVHFHKIFSIPWHFRLTFHIGVFV